MSQTAKLLQAATSHHQAGRFEEAEKAYHKLLLAEAINIDGLRLLGGLYLQTGQHQRAVDYLEKAARQLPRDVEILTNLGVALHRVGRSQDAIKRYQEALEAKPDYMTALSNLGGLYQEAHNFEGAIAVLEKVVSLSPDNHSVHFNYGNALLTAGRTSDAVGAYERALQIKPDFLEAMINLGMALSQSGKGSEANKWLGIARTWFDKALEVDPKNVVALNNIANVLRQEGRAEEAVSYYKRAIEIQPDYVEASINLATSLRDLNRSEEGLESCIQALRLRPDSANARINMGVMLQDLMRHQEAVDVFTEALKYKPSSLDAKWDKSLSLLALGQYEEGWKLHETGLGVAHMRGEYFSPDRRWNGEDIKGKRLLIWSEQGFGDSLQFIRYAELCKARGARIFVLCPRPLKKLFSNIPSVDEVPDKIENDDVDCHVPMMSLPHIFGTTLETIPTKIPYLQISEQKRVEWADKFGAKKGLNVGLVWAGNPREHQINAHMADRRRSMSLDMLRPLFDIEGITFYNLQMGAKAAQIDECGLRERFVDLMGSVKDFEDTAAIVEHLDLVISVDTSVVHLVGGMGKPVWIMSRFDACWRWLLNQEISPWYPTARVFGQVVTGDWTGVIEGVRQALLEKVAAEKRS
jgi:tetratricopeptide (TPR) repeat protein